MLRGVEDYDRIRDMGRVRKFGWMEGGKNKARGMESKGGEGCKVMTSILAHLTKQSIRDTPPLRGGSVGGYIVEGGIILLYIHYLPRSLPHSF